jgi:hypothetical protein
MFSLGTKERCFDLNTKQGMQHQRPLEVAQVAVAVTGHWAAAAHSGAAPSEEHAIPARKRKEPKRSAV